MSQKPINLAHLSTLIAVAILVGTELVGASWAAGWALGGLFQLDPTDQPRARSPLRAAGLRRPLFLHEDRHPQRADPRLRRKARSRAEFAGAVALQRALLRRLRQAPFQQVIFRNDREAGPPFLPQDRGRDQRARRRRRAGRPKPRRRDLQCETRRGRALLLRGAEESRRSGSSTSPIARPTSLRPKSPRRSTTRSGARSPTTPITRSSRIRKSASRSSFSTSACSSRRPCASMSSRTARRARSSTIRAISTCRRIPSRGSLPPGAGFRRLPHSGVEGRPARLEEERLGRLPRRLLFPRHRRIAPIWPLRARRRARHRQAGAPEEFPDFTHVYIGPRDARTASCLCAARRPVHRRRLQISDDARQGRRHGHRLLALSARQVHRASASRR